MRRRGDIVNTKNAKKESDSSLEFALAVMSYFSGQDFSKFDLDEPMPDLSGKVNGHQSSMSRYEKDGAATKTLRQLALGQDIIASIELVGSPETVAAKMGEAMDYVGGDGFLIASSVDRRNIATIADGLIPELQRRGLTRRAYEYDHFRDNLLAF